MAWRRGFFPSGGERPFVFYMVLEVWMTPSAFFSLSIPDGVERLMASRLIRREDLARTIAAAEKSGVKFISPGGGRSLAFLRQGNVTTWVEYGSLADVMQVYAAYSHRMMIKEVGDA